MNDNPDLSIFIKAVGKGYEMTLNPILGRPATYTLPLTSVELCGFIKLIHETLQNIVKESQYSDRIEISNDILDRDLRKIADLRIFEHVFLGVGANDDIKSITEELRRFSCDGERHIQIIADNFWIPWSLVYDRNIDESIVKDGFWGYKHLLDTPLATNEKTSLKWKFGHEIDSSNLIFGYNMNENIDRKWTVSWAKDQGDYFQTVEANNNPRFKLRARNCANDLLAEFKLKKFQDVVSYYFCHGKCVRNCDSSMTTDDIWIDIDDDVDCYLTLNLLENKTFDVDFVNEPIIFINACDAVDMSPLFYEGFVPFFFKKKSRGLIGTISKTPGIFARKFALDFFERFFAGKRVGLIMYDLRRAFIEEHNNLLGLFYASYCYSNTGLNLPLLKVKL